MPIHLTLLIELLLPVRVASPRIQSTASKTTFNCVMQQVVERKKSFADSSVDCC